MGSPNPLFICLIKSLYLTHMLIVWADIKTSFKLREVPTDSGKLLIYKDVGDIEALLHLDLFEFSYGLL